MEPEEPAERSKKGQGHTRTYGLSSLGGRVLGESNPKKEEGWNIHHFISFLKQFLEGSMLLEFSNK